MSGTNSVDGTDAEIFKFLQDRAYRRLRTSKQRIEFILKNGFPLDQIREWMRYSVQEHRKCHQKSETSAKTFRYWGSKFFAVKNYTDAIKWYTKAILSAPFPTKSDNFGNELSLSFAGRAIVAFEMKNYSSALFFIDSSLEFLESFEMLWLKVNCLWALERLSECQQISDQLSDKLENDRTLDMKYSKEFRRLKTKIDQKSAETKSEVREETDDTDKDQVWLHPTCELRRNSRKGRHIISKQFVPKNTVILVEEPIEFRLNNQVMNFCSNCLRPLDTQFWPCNGCNELSFCSKECQLKAHDQYHTHECGLVGLFNGKSPHFYTAYKLLSRVGVKRALELMADNDDYTIKEYMYSKNNETSFETRFKAFDCLVDNDDFNYGPALELLNVRSAILSAFILELSHHWNLDAETELQSLSTLAQLFLKMARKVRFNGFTFRTGNRYEPANGTMVFLIAALFNHSCCPNLTWETRNGKFVAKTICDIQEGQELNITFGPTVNFMNFIARHIRLRFHYFFSCDCISCLAESKNYISLQCPQCLGPVFCDFKHSDLEMDSDRFCLQCNTKLENWKILDEEVLELRNLFREEIEALNRYEKSGQSLRSAEKYLKRLIQLVSPSSIPLLHCMFRLIEVYAQYGLTDRAIAWSDAVEYLIDHQLKPISKTKVLPIQVINVLLLMTDLFSKYLKKSQVLDECYWNQYIRMNSKLIRLLEEWQKKPVKNENKFVGQLDRKLIEMKELKQLYDCLVAGIRDQLCNI